MAVSTAPVSVPRQPGVADFARLRLRVLRNWFRVQTLRVVAYVVSIVVGLLVASLLFLALAATAFASQETGLVIAVLAGGGFVLAWALVPLLFFGVDESLDPARFALLPIRRMTLARGMLAAAFIGVPPAITLVATGGLVFAAGLRSGWVAAIGAAIGVLLGLCTGVVASRAVTSAFASLLRSRRVRDLAGVIIALLASSIGPLQLLVSSRITGGSVSGAVPLARVVSWTPLGAPYAIPYDLAEGAVLAALARLALCAAGIGL